MWGSGDVALRILIHGTVWMWISGQHYSTAYLLPGKCLQVPSEPQSWDDLREQWTKCLLQSGEIRMAFEAVAVTGLHTTVSRTRKLRFRYCSSAVAFYCFLLLFVCGVATFRTFFCRCSIFSPTTLRSWESLHPGVRGGIQFIMVPVSMLTLNISPFCNNIYCTPLRSVVQPSCVDIIIIWYDMVWFDIFCCN
jgi:hypothetical protein